MSRHLVNTILSISFALCFNVLVYASMGERAAIDFFTGYLVEYSLSVDNLFVFMLIFNYFGVKEEAQPRVLFYGILGAILMRGAFIAMGSAIIENFHFAIYIFGAMLIYSGFKLLSSGDVHVEPERNLVYRVARRFIRVSRDYSGSDFFVRHGIKWYATPLLLVLISVEISDLIFAVDSIPAIFGITRDPIIVFTSNIFAIMGLRSLYFVLRDSMKTIDYLQYGLAIVLMFVGTKMLLEHYVHISNVTSLAFIASILAGSVGLSFFKSWRESDGREVREL
jgi:tellurite resistance protein TerC